MKKIKFRGKRILEPINIDQYAPNGWVYGGLIDCSDEMYILPYDVSGEMYIDRPYRFRANDYECRVMLAQVEPKSIGQFTGLTDKNGKEIYEGDIVQIYDIVGSVVFECGTFGLGFEKEIDYEVLEGYIYLNDTHYFDWHGCKNDNFISFFEIFWNFDNFNCLEVIGNIYDNTELLKGEKE